MEKRMLTPIRGIYREGKVELLGAAPAVKEAEVLVIFLTEAGSVDLPSSGIDENQAADLRRRLRSFAADWERPEMDVYDAV